MCVCVTLATNSHKQVDYSHINKTYIYSGQHFFTLPEYFLTEIGKLNSPKICCYGNMSQAQHHLK